uniref:gap junction beta-6 protein-like n=1 Tax=Myxine glutinosa TaxID=7769 RepID=UPI00358E3FCD
MQLWLLVMLLFRVMVLGVAGRRVWKDDQDGFSCNTQQPGCETVCFEQFFPISQLRLWTLQMLLVSCPAVFIALHIKYRKSHEKPDNKSDKKSDKESEEPASEEVSVEKMPGCMFWTYVSSVFCRIGMELGFTGLFYYIYGGFTLPRIIRCSETPCPNSVECYITRPSEKNIITYFMITSSIFCLLVSTAEIVYITLNRFLRVVLKIPPSSRKKKGMAKRPKRKSAV